MNILLIEDYEPELKVIKNVLERKIKDIRIETSDGTDYIKEDFIPDVIISDVVLPQKNGYEISKELKEKYPKAKIIIQTGQFNAADSEYAKLIHADYLLAKTAGAEKLVELVEKIKG